MNSINYFGGAAVPKQRPLTSPLRRPADVFDAADASDASVLRRAPRNGRRRRRAEDTTTSTGTSSSSSSSSSSSIRLAPVDAATPQRFRRRTGSNLEPAAVASAASGCFIQRQSVPLQVAHCCCCSSSSSSGILVRLFREDDVIADEGPEGKFRKTRVTRFAHHHAASYKKKKNNNIIN